jgi:hypothetical protein
LVTLALDGACVSVPKEILASNDPARIFEHVLGGEQLLPEVKLLLVGQGEVGKTHLRKRLFDEREGPSYHKVAEDRTHDIEMTVWRTKSEFSVERSDGKAETMTDVLWRVWDFGGQNALHGSHRFFVGAERCLYLLVLNAAQNAEQNRLDYWLRLLAHHGRKQSASGKSAKVERSPVLIVLTQCDLWELAGEVSDASIDLVDALATAQRNKWYGANVVACIGGFGWSDAVERLDQTRQQEIEQRHTTAAKRIVEELQRNIPDVLTFNYLFKPGFFAMKQWIEDYFARDPTDAEAKHFDWCNNTAFCEACDEAKLSKGLRESYLAVCRSLGLVHWVGDVPEIAKGYDTEMKNFVFNPESVKGPVYKLIRSADEDNVKGWMSNEQLDQRLFISEMPASKTHRRHPEPLDRFSFTKEDRDLIIKLMLACRVAFRVKNLQGFPDGLLIPDLIGPLPRPDRTQWTGDEVLHVRHRLDFLPERVFLRFIADHYKEIKSPQRNCWRDEVIVPYTDRRTNTTCEVLVQSELCPPPGEQPFLDISIRDGSPDARERIADEVLKEFAKILSREELACGLIDREETPRDRDADEARHTRFHANPMSETVIAKASQPRANEVRTSATGAGSSGVSLVNQWEQVTNKDELRKLVTVTDAPFILLWYLFEAWKHDHVGWVNTASIRENLHLESAAMSKSKDKLAKALQSRYGTSIRIEDRSKRPTAYRLVVSDDSASAGND